MKNSLRLRLRIIGFLILLISLSFPLDAAAQIVITQNTTIASDNTSYDNQSIIIDGCTVTIDGNHSFQSLTLRNSAVLTHTGATATTTSRLELTITTTFSIDTTSKIDVTGKGYLGAHQGDNSSSTGRTIGNTTIGDSVRPHLFKLGMVVD